MRAISLAGWVLAALLLMSWSPVGAQEATHEILVGYNSEADRRDSEKELAGAKDKLKVRGQSLESLLVQAIGEKTLKLQIGLPAALKAEIARTPSAEASILQGLADQLKQSDKRIAYAHPNWVMRGLPPAARTSSLASRQESRRAAKAAKRVAKAAKRAKTHVARKRGRAKLVATRGCRCRRDVAWVPRCGMRPIVARFGRW